MSQKINSLCLRSVSSTQGLCCSNVFSQGDRKSQEDKSWYTECPDGSTVYVVADGHSGDMAARLIVQWSSEYIQKNTFPNTQELADEFCRSMDDRLRTQFIQDGKIIEDSGCTCSMLLIRPVDANGKRECILLAVGDSPLYLFSTIEKKWMVVFGNDHHVFVESEQKRVKDAGGYVFGGRVNGELAMTRAFGDFKYKRSAQKKWHEQMVSCQATLRNFSLCKGDIILFGSDGMQWTPNCRIFAESLDRTFATIPEALQRMDSFALFNTISTRMQRGDDNLTMFAINVASVQDQKLPSVPRDGVLFPIFVSKKDALALAKQELVSYTGVSDADWKLFINFNESLIDICNEINCEIMQDALWSDNLMSLVSQVPLCPLTPSPAQLTIYLDEFVRFCRKWAIKTASDIDSDYQQQLEDAFSHVPYPSFSVFSDPVVNEPDSSSVSLESTLPLK